MNLPVVRMLVACQDVVVDLADGSWVIRRPYHTVWMPPGVTKNFGQRELWVYAQLSDGLGEFSLGVEFVPFDPSRPSPLVLGRSEPERRHFVDRLEVHEVAFRLRNVAIPKPGQYEFRLLAGGKVLENGTAYLDVLAGEAS
jgi:hypothetical protein